MNISTSTVSTTSSTYPLSTAEIWNHAIQFYAPNQETHHFFNTPWEEVIKHCSNNFTTWIVGTYARIKQAGIPCEIVSHLPAQGIVIADRDSLGNHYPYLPNTLIVCACADREFHPSAYFHIVQNPVALTKKKNALWRPHYIPHWIQPNLIPRSAERGDRVENVAFIGTRSNLAKEFSSETWLQGLKDIGCNWLPILSLSAGLTTAISTLLLLCATLAALPTITSLPANSSTAGLLRYPQY